MQQDISWKVAESIVRFASKVPSFNIESSDPTSAATGVPTNKIVLISMNIGLDSGTINNTNITISPSVSRTTSLQPDGRTIRISPAGTFAASTLYTITITNGVRGLYGSSYVQGIQRTMTFTTA